MAVVDNSSATITSLDAGKLVEVTDHGGRMRVIAARLETTADDDGSVYRMARVPSNARLAHVWAHWTALGADNTIAVGLYQTAANGGTAVDTGAYADVVDAENAGAADVLTASYAIAALHKRVWEIAGADADTNREYDIAITVAIGGDPAAATFALQVEYVVD